MQGYMAMASNEPVGIRPVGVGCRDVCLLIVLKDTVSNENG
jgi:hypothetical protein